MTSLLYTQIYMSSYDNTLFMSNITQVCKMWDISNTKCAHGIIWYFINKGQSSVAFIKTGYILVNESTTFKNQFFMLLLIRTLVYFSCSRVHAKRSVLVDSQCVPNTTKWFKSFINKLNHFVVLNNTIISILNASLLN